MEVQKIRSCPMTGAETSEAQPASWKRGIKLASGKTVILTRCADMHSFNQLVTNPWSIS